MGDHIVSRQLNNLTKTLDKTYSRIRNDVDCFERQEAERLLSLICFAKRTLTLSKLIDPLAIDFQDPDCKKNGASMHRDGETAQW